MEIQKHPDEYFCGRLVETVHLGLSRAELPGRGFGFLAREAIAPRTTILTCKVFAPGKTRRGRLHSVLARRNDPDFEKMMQMSRTEGLCRQEVNYSLLEKHNDVARKDLEYIMDIIGTNDHGPGFFFSPSLSK